VPAASPAALRAAAAHVEAVGAHLAPALDGAAAALRPTVWLGPAASRLAVDVSNGRRRLAATRAALASSAVAMRAEADRLEADARLTAAILAGRGA
jgi:hypothetical protein